MRLLALIAALIGSAAGAGYVLADTPPRPAAVAAVSTPAPKPAAKWTLKLTTTPRIALQVADPGGAAPWAVRVYRGTSKGEPLECADLGRIVDGRFGWIGRTGAFKLGAPGKLASPTLCESARFLRQIGAQVVRGVLIDARYAPARTFTWGHADPSIARIEPRGEPPIPVTADHVFLTVQAGEAAAPRPTGELVSADGRRRAFNEDHATPPPRPRERPIASTRAVGAIAPDPAGGMPWGMITARGEHGGTCFELPQPLVGSHAGMTDAQYDVFYATPFEDEMQCSRDASRPRLLETLVSGAGQDAGSRGRIERRLLDGRTVFFGTVEPGVASVTIRTPRDVRTLIPTKARGILAVYEGTFPFGEITATAAYRDGHTKTTRLESGGV